MKKSVVVSILFLLVLTGCSRIVNYSVQDININNYENEPIKKWVENNSRTKGVYLGKIDNDKVERYYLYVNYSFKEISIGSESKDSIIIDTKTRDIDEKNEVLLCVTIKDASFKKFILNGQDIKSSAVSVIKK